MAFSPQQRLCLTLLGLGFVLNFGGVASPYWAYLDIKESTIIEAEFEMGVIYACASARSGDQSIAECKTFPWKFDDVDDKDNTIFQAIRVLMGLSFSFMIVTIVAVIATSCKQQQEAPSLTVPASIGVLSGLLGLAGVTTFFFWLNNEVFSDISEYSVDVEFEKGWSYYLSLVGNILVLLDGLASIWVPKRRVVVAGVSNSGYNLAVNSSSAVSNSGYNMAVSNNTTQMSGFSNNLAVTNSSAQIQQFY